MRVCAYILLVFVFDLTVARPVGASEVDRTNWLIAPYVWAVDTRVDLAADDAPIGGGDISFADLMDTRDASLQVFFEDYFASSNWSAFIDVTYLKASDSRQTTATGSAIRIDSDSTQWFVDLGFAYWPRGEAGGLNFFGGVRYTSLDDRYDFADVNPDQALGMLVNDRDFFDALIGVRYRLNIAPHWALVTRADYAFGDSDGIPLLQAVLRYAFGKDRRHGLSFGYRYKESEFETDSLQEDYEFGGPLVGVDFRF